MNLIKKLEQEQWKRDINRYHEYKILKEKLIKQRSLQNLPLTESSILKLIDLSMKRIQDQYPNHPME